MSMRINNYVSAKQGFVRAMEQSIEQITRPLVYEILEELERSLSTDRAEDMFTTVRAMHQSAPSIELRKTVPPRAQSPTTRYSSAIAQILECYECNTGLTLTSVELGLDNYRGNEIWGCFARFLCPAWQSMFERNTKSSAYISIQVYFDDEDHRRTELKEAPFLEMGDLVHLKSAADEYWLGPVVWAKARNTRFSFQLSNSKN